MRDNLTVVDVNVERRRVQLLLNGRGVCVAVPPEGVGETIITAWDDPKPSPREYGVACTRAEIIMKERDERARTEQEAHKGAA